MKIEKALQFHGDPRADRLLAGLAEAGCSDTRARRAVVRALCAVPDRATPAELLARGRTDHPRLSAVTVYRTLELLRSLGLVERLHHADGCGAFVPTPSAHGHHVTCERCRRTVEFSGCAIEGLAKAAHAQTGFSVHGHWLELTGLCPSCRRSAGRAS
ncbi:MAG TPA: transcriptional repressor [Desulfobacterales bacterium]|nr:transcriptional repressor [Desulfobacterales bacterium]